MRRAGYYKKKQHKPDHKYERVDVGRFINYLMWDGKKNTAENLFYDAMNKIGKETGEDPMTIFDKAMENASPRLEVVSRRIGGANYQIPRDIRPDRKFFLATHWIIDAARKSKGSPMHMRLADEIVAAAKGEGAAVKKKQDTHKMAEANRAFASFLR